MATTSIFRNSNGCSIGYVYRGNAGAGVEAIKSSATRIIKLIGRAVKHTAPDFRIRDTGGNHRESKIFLSLDFDRAAVRRFGTM